MDGDEAVAAASGTAGGACWLQCECCGTEYAAATSSGLHVCFECTKRGGPPPARTRRNRRGGGAAGDDTEAGLSARRLGVVCYVCGHEFSTASLPIHVPQCLKKRALQQLRLPPEYRTPLNAVGYGFDLWPDTSEVSSWAQQEKLKREVNEVNEAAYQANMPHCQQCGRSFSAVDRLALHQASGRCNPPSSSFGASSMPSFAASSPSPAPAAAPLRSPSASSSSSSRRGSAPPPSQQQQRQPLYAHRHRRSATSPGGSSASAPAPSAARSVGVPTVPPSHRQWQQQSRHQQQQGRASAALPTAAVVDIRLQSPVPPPSEALAFGLSASSSRTIRQALVLLRDSFREEAAAFAGQLCLYSAAAVSAPALALPPSTSSPGHLDGGQGAVAPSTAASPVPQLLQ